MQEEINTDRRRFLSVAALTIAGARLSASAAAPAQTNTTRAFGELRQIDAGVLSVGYADVAPLLASKGYRVLVPYLRGYGTTRFLSAETLRNGQQAALAADCVAFMDALRIERAVVAGFDWGARTANIVAALWPQRCKAMVSVSGYLIGNREANKMPLPPQAELEWWYQYYFATDRGRAGYDKYRHEFAKLIWQIASPKWRFDDATFQRTAKAFDKSGSRERGDPQLPLASRPGRWRIEVRQARRAPGDKSRDHGAHGHS